MEIRRKAAVKASILLIIVGIFLIWLVVYLSQPASLLPNIPVSNADDAAAFLSELNWECDTAQITAKESILPEVFDALFTAYNALQLQQGCDLSKYTGKEITIYTLPITNYPNAPGMVYATLLVYEHRVIGGDIHAAELDGFMHALI